LLRLAGGISGDGKRDVASNVSTTVSAYDAPTWRLRTT